MASADEIDVEFDSDRDRLEINLERNFRIIKELLAASGAPEAVRFVGAAGEPAFQNGWINYGVPVTDVGFYLHNSRVYLHGVAKNGTANAAIFTLPVGYRPVATKLIATPTGTTVTSVQIDANGDVLATNANTALYSLDGVSFRI